uniref:Ac76 n=1 Tax=Helicoverpa armigera nucleopolyhedrovirus TaxID=51313 RepID=A0A0E3JB39_9ABAC|nr:hypothetical protein ORF-69 [Helicoverpa armigera nucleopolyhedrovirus]AJP07764.1 hypothetical protein ORF-69 [Helicoverpa armigera nucleopolyhedrovirus]
MQLYFAFLFLIALGFIFDKNEGFSTLMFFLLLLFFIFIMMLHVYYIKPDSTPADLQTGKSKSIKKKRELERAFDAIINKNTSSID